VSITWRGDISGNLRVMAEKARHLQDDAYEGAKVVLEDSDARVPKESGDLASSGVILRDRGGDNTVAIAYRSVYAHWIHEHMFFKHPHGGEAKFLETAMLVKGSEFLNKAGEHFWRRL